MTILSDRLAAALAGRYTLAEEVGAGGMAIVFAAEDVRHRRRVAVKVLRPELAASLGADRFLREIETAAGLQHPHILPVYDSGASADGTLLYYVMPFVEGESLSARIERDGPLPVADAVQVAREVAGALAHAHARGVVHRDIKPDNVLLMEGHAMVADFGVARAVSAASAGGRLTATGMAVGTPMYMSPEQALGSDELDGRSDIYSLGCVLYEMLSGQQPFRGASLQSVIAQSITAPRPHVRVERPEVPEALDALLVRALAREPVDRFATAAEFAAALGDALHGVAPRAAPAGGRGGEVATAPVPRPNRRVMMGAAAAALLAAVALAAWKLVPRGPDAGSPAAPAGAAAADSAAREVIAVLPFRASGGGDARLIGEGMVDLLSTNLDAVGGIRAVDPRAVLTRWRARTSQAAAAGGAAGAELGLDDALAIAREVRASAVMTGSVVAVGPTVRVSAEIHSLAAAPGAAPLARAQVDGAADSLLSLVDALSVKLLREMWRGRSGPMPSLSVSALTTASLPALRAYLEGEQRYRRSDWKAAAAAFTRAIEADSTFALAYVRLATTHSWLSGYGSANQRSAREAGLRYAARLSERDRALSRGERMFEEQDPGVLDSAQLLVTRYPDDVDAWMLLGEVLFHGRTLFASAPAELRAPFDRVLALDPSLGSALLHLVDMGLLDGDSAAFHADFARFRSSGPPAELVEEYALAGRALWGDPSASAAAARALLALKPQRFHAAIAGAYHTPSRTPHALLGELTRYRAALPARDSVLWLQTALIESMGLAGLGRLAAARLIADSVLARSPRSSFVLSRTMAPVMAGYADSTYIGRELQTLRAMPPGPMQFLLLATYALRHGDARAATTAANAALAMDSTRLPTPARPFFTAAQGWARIASGDTTAGVRELSLSLGRLGFGGVPDALAAPFRFEWAMALSRNAPTRDEGIRRFRYGFEMDHAYIPATYLARAEALEAAGDRAGAAAAYERFLVLWERADPSLGPVVERARAGRARVSGRD